MVGVNTSANTLIASLDTVATTEHNEVLCIVGPTATGKTDLAISLANQLHGEVINVDSIQIYRHFNIGSGKPSAEQIAHAPHHLIDIADPLDPFDAKQFASLADAAIHQVQSRGKVAILCGGTFLWMKAVLQGLAPSAGSNDVIRQKHRSIVEEQGAEALYRMLQQIDPHTATKLHTNDVLRISRALEVFELSGKPQSVWHNEHQFGQMRYPYQLLSPYRERAELDTRIEMRTSHWLDNGWIEEVQTLFAQGYGKARAMDSVGYRQVRAFVEGALSRDALLSAIVQATRVFVRRQRTWLRDQPIQWIRMDK